MQARRAEIGGIVDARLGWDITDYGLGKFDELGLFLFTVRNGDHADLKTRPRHALRREDHDLAQGPAFADAPAQHQGRGHHQPRRRHAGAGTVHADATAASTEGAR